MSSKALFDNEAASKLIENSYDNLSLSELSKWLNMPINWVSKRIKQGVSTGKWGNQFSDISSQEIELINHIIENEQTFYMDNDHEIMIAILRIWSIEAEIKLCIFIRNRNVIKCIDVFDQSMLRKLLDHGYLIYGPREFKLKKMFKKVIILGEEYGWANCDTKKQMKNYINTVYNEGGDYNYYSMVSDLGFYDYLPNNILNAYNKYKEEIKDYVVEMNKVDIPSSSSLYKRMYQFAFRRGKSINFLIQEFGYERIYKEYSTILKSEKFNRPNIDEYRRVAILNKLQRIQGDLGKTHNEELKSKRRHDLVYYLKKLYSYRCQICKEDDGIPLIEKADGSYYIEVHHIIPINISDSKEEEQKWIDSYKNCLVVCPHHHKYLHYHHGGFFDLVNQEGNIYLLSKRGTKVHIYVNYHL